MEMFVMIAVSRCDDEMVMIMTVYYNEEIWIASSGLCVCVNSSWQCGGFNGVSLCVCVWCVCVCVCVCERDWCSLCSLSHLCLGAAVAHRCVCVKEYGDPYSELVLCIYPSKVHTHSSEHTHTPWTHTRSSGQPFMLRRLGSSWGFGALLKGSSVVVLKVERAGHSLPPPTIPAGPRLELTTFQLRVWLTNH